MGRLKAGTTGVLGIGDAVARVPEPARAKVLARSVRWPRFCGRHAVRNAAAQAANIPAHRPCATRGLRRRHRTAATDRQVPSGPYSGE